jgi:VWFA-related protein
MVNRIHLAALCALIPAATMLSAQTNPSAQTNSTPSAEVSTQEAPLTFKSGLNLVPVPVVVRDSRGNAIGTLGVEDFQIFDNGKPQTISKFTVEKLTREPVSKPTVAATDKPPANGATLVDANTEGIPDRYVAYLFDDLHMPQGELVYTRDAAWRQIQASSDPRERTAIYTTSGVPMQEFTTDKEKLHAALFRVGGGYATMEQRSCPRITFYMADQIINRGDTDAFAIALQEIIDCGGSPAKSPIMAVQAAAQQSLAIGDRDSAAALDVMRAVVMRMAAMAGQRTLVLVSPGFLVLNDRHDEQTRLIERAIRANVVISALDSRGLIGNLTIPDASQHGGMPTLQKSIFVATEALVQAEVMEDLAQGTGGTFYHGTNDYDEGIALTAATPDYIYVLGFSPTDLKLDGKYHNLKITIKGIKGMELQARKGYYAPKYAPGLAEQASQEVEDAFFSLNEVHELPATLKTQYLKTDNGDATLSAVAKVDVKKLAFRKEGGRNIDSLTVVTGLFDNDGNYVTGLRKVVDLKLLDETLENRIGSGIAVRNDFTVHPGRYVVRMVVRDSEGQAMSEQSSLVEIP